ncbi:MAG: MerR family DNA-binding transcriptional regulator [Patescibacteria group bacterium]
MPKKFLTVKEVSRLLGVTPLTVRNWDQRGKLLAYRHPVNNYRLYKTEDVEALLRQIDQSRDKLRPLKIDITSE